VPNVSVVRIRKNLDRDDVIQAFIVDTVTESAVRDFMTSIGYAEDEYEITQGDKAEVQKDMIDHEIWYNDVSIDWGKVILKLV